MQVINAALDSGYNIVEIPLGIFDLGVVGECAQNAKTPGESGLNPFEFTSDFFSSALGGAF